MKFKDHIRDYRLGDETFDYDAANAHLWHLLSLILRFRCFTVIGNKACMDMVRFVRQACIQSEQADRYRRKLWMLRTKAWREKVFEDLGGIKAMLRWYAQPPKTESLKRQRKILTQDEMNYRIHFRFHAKQAANPQIVRDPCKLDEEGMFRLAPIRRHHNPKPADPTKTPREYDYDPRPLYKIRGFSEPIMVWPDEFLVFGEWERERDESLKAKERRMRVRTWCTAQALMAEALTRAHKQAAVYAPP